MPLHEGAPVVGTGRLLTKTTTATPLSQIGATTTGGVLGERRRFAAATVLPLRWTGLGRRERMLAATTTTTTTTARMPDARRVSMMALVDGAEQITVEA